MQRPGESRPPCRVETRRCLRGAHPAHPDREFPERCSPVAPKVTKRTFRDGHRNGEAAKRGESPRGGVAAGGATRLSCASATGRQGGWRELSGSLHGLGIGADKG